MSPGSASIRWTGSSQPSLLCPGAAWLSPMHAECGPGRQHAECGPGRQHAESSSCLQSDSSTTTSRCPAHLFICQVCASPGSCSFTQGSSSSLSCSTLCSRGGGSGHSSLSSSLLSTRQFSGDGHCTVLAVRSPPRATLPTPSITRSLG